MINGQYIVLSFKEWNNWIAQGLLKIHSSRIQPYLNTQQSFFNLMNTAADITHLDDNEYILAKLSKSYSSSTYQSEHTLASYISLEAVQQFYALTERGKFALKHSANNLQVSLAIDLEIEKFWEAYRLDQKKILEHEKALKFTRLIWDNKIPEESLLDLINNKTLNEYFNPAKYEITHLKKQDDKFTNRLFSAFSHLEKYEQSKAYAGMFTRLLFKLEVNNPVLIEKYEEISNLCSSKEDYASLKEQQTKDELTSKFLSNKILREKILTEYILLEAQIKHLPLLALSVYFHYEMLIKHNYSIDLSTLKKDIYDLNFFYGQSEYSEYSEYKKLPYLVIYTIGKLLPDEFINTLYYFKSKVYPCFHPTNQFDLERALPDITDEEQYETILNQLNEEISKSWIGFNTVFNLRSTEITPSKNIEETKASHLTQATGSTNITHPSEKDLDTQPQIAQVPEITDLNTHSEAQSNQLITSPIVTAAQSPSVDQQPPMSAQQPEQISLIVEHQVNEESLPVSAADETMAMPQNPLLIEHLIRLFNDPEIQDLKSLIGMLKKDSKFNDITTQGKLRERLVTEGILNPQDAPKNGDKLFNYMKREIAKKS